MATLRQLCFCGGLFACSASASQALAGAWPMEQGRTEIIFSQTYTDTGQRFDRRGGIARAGRFAKGEAAARGAYGLTDAVSLLAGARGTGVSLPDQAGRRYAFQGAMEAGARIQIWRDPLWVVSLQGLASVAGERSLPGRFRRLDPPFEGDLRLQAGRSFTFGGTPAFGELQAGYRLRGGAPDEIRLDATLGFRPTPDILVLLQSFSAMALTADRRYGGGRYRQHKLQPSIVYAFNERWSLQVGGFVSVSGREALLERGGLVALWWRM